MVPSDPANTNPEIPEGGLLRFAGGQYVVKEGDPGGDMYIVEEGTVEILKRSGGEERRLLLLRPGDFFGEESVVAGLPRLVSARAVTDCRLLPVDELVLRQILEQGADTSLRLLQGLTSRLREALRLVPGIATQRVEARSHGSDKDWTPEVKAEDGFAKLVHVPSGTEFQVPDKGEVKIGRHDAITGTDPDIDLSSLDIEHSLSRSHAQILRRGDKVFVGDEIGSANGTFVNGQRVEKGTPIEIEDGDELRFGLITTRFRAFG